MTAVVVLYNRSPSDSKSFSSLVEILSSHREWAKHISLVVYDNSPPSKAHEISVDFPFHYVHNPENGGLATAYNYALARAEELNHEWLLLLDQDTCLTEEYFSELIPCADRLHSLQDVAVIAPKLEVKGQIYSPAAHYIDILRRHLLRGRRPVESQVVGVQEGRLMAYNSGATFRVSALRAIGGFPGEFWLDYLDHAVFHDLFLKGYRMYIMRSMLEHDASEADFGELPIWRLRNVISAQTLFVKRVGNLADQLLYRISLVRYSVALWVFHKDRRAWREAALQALLMRVPKTSAPGSH